MPPTFTAQPGQTPPVCRPNLCSFRSLSWCLCVAGWLAALAAAAPAQSDILDGIDRMLRVGRGRDALQSLYALRQIQDAGNITPRFLLLEAKAFLANGLLDDAQSSLELLKDWPNWEDEIDENEMLTTELSVLKALGQSADALRLLESQLPPLDELEPPYPGSVTQLHLAHAELLLACLRSGEAVRALFDLIQNSEPRQKASVTQALLSAAEQQALTNDQWKELPGILSKVEGNSYWTGFAKAAFECKKPDVAREILRTGIATAPSMLRAQWPGFLDSITEPEFLAKVSDSILSSTEEVSPQVQSDWLAIKAVTLERNGRADEAVQLIRDKLWGDVSLEMRVAKILADRGDNEGASKIYSDLEAAHPGQYLDAWGSFLADHGMTAKALEVWARIPELDKRSDAGYLRWGQLLKSKGFLKEAADAYRQGMAKAIQPAVFSQDLLEVSISLQDVEGALSAYQLLRSQTQRIGGLWSPERLIDQLRRTQQMEAFGKKLAEVLSATETVKAAWRDFAVEMETELALQLNQGGILERWLSNPPAAAKAYWGGNLQRRMNHFTEIATALSLQGENALASRFFNQVDLLYLAARPNNLEAAARASGAIGDSTKALTLWEALIEVPQSSSDQRIKATLAAARLNLDMYRPGKALATLGRITGVLKIPSYQAEVTYLKGLAYTQLHEGSKAIPLLEEILDNPGNHTAEAQFWLAEWALWQRNWEEAKTGYRDVLAADPGQALSNEALWRLRYLDQLEEGKLPAFSMACFFEAAGDWKEAEKNYRVLAATLGQEEITDWIYYRIGRNLIAAGKKDHGLAQWKVLLEKSKNQTLTRRIQFETAELNGSGAKSFEDLVLEMPNTLLGDLARERMREVEVPTPEPARSEMVP
jgi:hypothetical protein